MKSFKHTNIYIIGLQEGEEREEEINLFKNIMIEARPKVVEDGVDVTLTSTQNKSGATTKLWRNHPEQTTEH